ncbi:MAG: Lrp/AsnC family transcriptional regulator [Desulfovibrio sp.]|jgi:DNA-binding Lrp family transcriptional regulator|nr:Lrp/AsnC family transcriptional regulator [Desulfovibrio sp.]
MPIDFTDAELAVLRIVQADLPDSLTPYADMAAEAGMTEDQVLALLTRLKKNGAIRRFGASIRHQKTGWTHNAMVAWKVDEANADLCGALAAGHDHISHVYYRPGPEAVENWPYALYTMVHGRSEAECLYVVESLAKTGPLKEYAILNSLKELKKISMTYFA